MRILVIGDSITADEGMSSYLPDAFAHEIPGSEVVVEANSGWSTGRWMRNQDIYRAAHAVRPDVVILELGTNDEDPGADPHDYEVLISNAVADASHTGAEVFWLGPFGGGDYARRFEIIREIVGRTHVIDGMRLAEGLERAGELHFRIRQYDDLAERLAVEVAARLRGEYVARDEGPDIWSGLAAVALGAGLVITLLLIMR
jgi:hypothetical protein